MASLLETYIHEQITGITSFRLVMLPNDYLNANTFATLHDVNTNGSQQLYMV